MKPIRNLYFILLTVIFLSCTTGPSKKEQAIVTPPVAIEPSGEEFLTEDYLTIIAVGDNLYHDVMIKAGEEGDYETAYLEIKPLIQNADLAFINQETLLAGKNFGFSGYPSFNSPQNMGRALAASGFNVINHATNHVMDKGEEALIATMDFWDSYSDVTILGIHRSRESRSLPVLLKKNNITVGFLSYTYGTNAIPLPKDKPYMVSLIDTEIMSNEINALRPLCDFLIVSMHWGEEYKHEISKSQEDLAAMLAKHDVDLVIGHHPHVIQKIEKLIKQDGKNMLCYYSLGNLISAQTQNATLLGAMAFVRIKKTKGNATPVIEKYGAIPLVTHYEKDFSGFKVYPLYAYNEELAEKHWKTGLTMDYLKELSAGIFGEREITGNPFE